MLATKFKTHQVKSCPSTGEQADRARFRAGSCWAFPSCVLIHRGPAGANPRDPGSRAFMTLHIWVTLLLFCNCSKTKHV